MRRSGKNARQLEFPLLSNQEPAEQYSEVHERQYGQSLICQLANSNLATIRIINPQNYPYLNELLSPLKGQESVYFTPSEFHSPRRTTDQLAKINSFHIDLDKKLFRFSDKTLPYNWTNELNILSAINKILSFIKSKKLPLPKLVTHTGNGYHLYWLLKEESYHCLPYWSLLQRNLIELLRPIGADPACCDPTRILRLAGTRHENGNIVQFYNVINAQKRWKLRQIYPLIHESYQNFISIPKNPNQAAQIVARGQKREILKYNPGWKNIRSFFQKVLDDLIKIAKAQPNQQIPEGFRDE